MMSDDEFQAFVGGLPGSLGMICRCVRHYVTQGMKLPTVLRVDEETYHRVLLDIKTWNVMVKHPEMELNEWPMAPDGAPMIGSIRLEAIPVAEIAEALKNPHPNAQHDYFAEGMGDDSTQAVMVRRRKPFDDPQPN